MLLPLYRLKGHAINTLIYWFRNDLRLADNPALIRACTEATLLLPVYCHDPAQDAATPWGGVRMDHHRRHFLAATLADLKAQLAERGSLLLELTGAPETVLPALMRATGASAIHCETIAAPEEMAQVASLHSAGIVVRTSWQSSMLAPADLPFPAAALPDVFTSFRQAVERAGVVPAAPLSPPVLPACPEISSIDAALLHQPSLIPVQHDARSSFPYSIAAFKGGESAATAHLARYFGQDLAHTYKQTRNCLTGTDYSSKFSPWLASGALSARSACAALRQFEAAHGANDSTYWLWFELLWRDYFRLLNLKYGRRLYQAQGLSQAPPPSHDSRRFQRWCRGETGEPLVDAGMHELAATGYLSNRLRQMVASFLIHDLACDWRAGAAWFESQLLDYDVCSNQGNWLYVAGRGTDPRGGRRFNPQKQAHDHDPAGLYQALWRTVGSPQSR